jgi:hypothetical protein
MVSIYISLATLKDEEIINTVNTALSFARNPNDVYIGIAFMTDEHFYSDTLDKINNLSNVHCKRFDPSSNVGVGTGRYNSRFAYNGEDYILQVDSHTNFEPDWDISLLKFYEESLSITNNEKTLLTAYLGKYRLQNGIREIVDRHTRYSFFTDDSNSYNDIGFNLWQFFPIPEILGINERYLPSNKFNANFAFGNHSFANYSGLPKSCIFYDEEIIQSINLVDAGFSLVFPNFCLPIQHLYSQHNDSPRETVGVLVDDVASRMKESYSNFINDKINKQKCLKYQEYAHYSIKSNRFDALYIPDRWEV